MLLRVSARACVGKVGAGTVEEAEENAQMLVDAADRMGGFVLLSARADISYSTDREGGGEPCVCVCARVCVCVCDLCDFFSSWLEGL